MTLHPDSATVLERMAAWGAPAEFSVELSRKLEVRRHREFAGPPEPVASVQRVRIPTTDGSVPALVYSPQSGHVDGLLVYLFGGGWVHGSPELSDELARALANAGDCLVVSVGYRLAPEHRFPAGLDDSYAAMCWAADHSNRLGAPPGRMIVCGASSGGNLAAAACLMARDRGGPKLLGQLLMYPSTARDLDTQSRRDFAEGYGLTPEALAWYWDQYLGPGQDPRDKYASPLLAEDLSGLPPAVILTAACDILRDDGEAYGDRLRSSGVPVVSRRFDGVLHGFLGTAGVVRVARSAFDWVGAELRRMFREAALPVNPADSHDAA